MEFYVIENKKGLYLYGNSKDDKFKFCKPGYTSEDYRLQAWFSAKQAKVAADEVLGIKEYTIKKVITDEKDDVFKTDYIGQLEAVTRWTPLPEDPKEDKL